jgi:hypothetical protein
MRQYQSAMLWQPAIGILNAVKIRRVPPIVDQLVTHIALLRNRRVMFALTQNEHACNCASRYGLLIDSWNRVSISHGLRLREIFIGCFKGSRSDSLEQVPNQFSE